MLICASVHTITSVTDIRDHHTINYTYTSFAWQTVYELLQGYTCTWCIGKGIWCDVTLCIDTIVFQGETIHSYYCKILLNGASPLYWHFLLPYSSDPVSISTMLSIGTLWYNLGDLGCTAKSPCSHSALNYLFSTLVIGYLLGSWFSMDIEGTCYIKWTQSNNSIANYWPVWWKQLTLWTGYISCKSKDISLLKIGSYANRELSVFSSAYLSVRWYAVTVHVCLSSVQLVTITRYILDFSKIVGWIYFKPS